MIYQAGLQLADTKLLLASCVGLGYLFFCCCPHYAINERGLCSVLVWAGIMEGEGVQVHWTDEIRKGVPDGHSSNS